MTEPFGRLARNILSIFSGRNLWWHALAIVLTAGIVSSGFDWSYYLSTRGEAFVRCARPAILLGSIVPILGTLAVLAIGTVVKSRNLVTAAWALAQAALLGYLVSCCYKAFTGRLPPPFRGFRMSAANMGSQVDSSHGFQFGLLKGGVFWGWPSSHTTVAFAMALCLITLHPRNRMLVCLASAYALYIGLGISVTIHWFSEFVAGALFGSVTGMVVGGSFKTGSSSEPGR